MTCIISHQINNTERNTARRYVKMSETKINYVQDFEFK